MELLGVGEYRSPAIAFQQVIQSTSHHPKAEASSNPSSSTRGLSTDNVNRSGRPGESRVMQWNGILCVAVAEVIADPHPTEGGALGVMRGHDRG